MMLSEISVEQLLMVGGPIATALFGWIIWVTNTIISILRSQDVVRTKEEAVLQQLRDNRESSRREHEELRQHVDSKHTELREDLRVLTSHILESARG